MENHFKHCKNFLEVKTVYQALYKLYKKDAKAMQTINQELKEKKEKFSVKM